LSARVSLNRADLICPVHESMISYNYTYWDVKYKTQGIKAFIPDLKTPFFPIHNGFDRNLWGVDQKWSERKIDVMCVFSLGAKNRSVLKGADLIIAIARRNPSLRFRIIGEAPADFDLPENCEVISNCDQQELRGHYNEAKLFVQASITEGFPNTLCEAMACGCFPIGSRVSSIPSIIANYGLILERREVALLERLIVEALVEVKNGQLTTKAISKSIFERYSIVGRSGKLMEALHQLSKQTERS
jgi:glycosyltransferase involved in cell wall biosynthesis